MLGPPRNAPGQARLAAGKRTKDEGDAMSDPSAGAPTGPARILVVDDHPLFCDALVITLTGALPGAEVATANRLEEALALVAGRGAPDAVLLDLHIPGTEGLEGIVRLREAAPAARLLVVSSMSDNRMITSALSAGAHGFVPKDAPRGTLIEALDRVWRGAVWVPPGYVPSAAGALDATEDDGMVERLRTLTPRQARILELVSAGKLNKQIAWELSIAETTVKAHVTAILRKLCVRSRTQAVLAAQQARFASILQEIRQDA